MSYDVCFNLNGERVYLTEPVDLRGGTYALGGIRALYELPAEEVARRIRKALGDLSALAVEEHGCTCKKTANLLGGPWKSTLDHDPFACYWAVTKSNVESCLRNLLTLAEAVPATAVFNGD